MHYSTSTSLNKDTFIIKFWSMPKLLAWAWLLQQSWFMQFESRGTSIYLTEQDLKENFLCKSESPNCSIIKLNGPNFIIITRIVYQLGS